MSAPLFSKGTRFLLCLFVIKFPLFDIEIPDGLHNRCNHRGHFRNSGHNLGAETPGPAGTPQPDPRQDRAGSSCDPHRNQGNAESWKTHHKGQKHCSQPKARERFHLTLVQTTLQVTGFHRDGDQTHASPRRKDRHAGNVCQRCGSSWGRTPAKETLWRQRWSPSDWQVSGLGTSSPGENVRK